MSTSVKYGLMIAAAIGLVQLVLLDLAKIESEVLLFVWSLVPMVVLAAGLVMGMRKIKLEEYKMEMNYGQAIYTGIVLSAYAALSYGVFNYVYYQFFHANAAANEIARVTPLLVKNKVPATEIKEVVNSIKSTYMPINQLTGTFVMMLLYGIVLSAVISAFLRTKDTFTQIFKGKE